MIREALSPLECAILGVVESMGPTTPYAVRRVFEDSPSSHWSGSSGAVYPAVRRLHTAGLLEARPRASDGRGTKEFVLTAAGRTALQAWLSSAVNDSEAAYAFDPIRLRVIFMGTLPLAAQRTLIRNALDVLHARRVADNELQESMANPGVVGSRRAAQGARLLLDARIVWLEQIAAELTAEEEEAE